MNFLYAILPVSMLLRSAIYVFGLSSRPWGFTYQSSFFINGKNKQGENLVYVDSPHKVNMVKS